MTYGVESVCGDGIAFKELWRVYPESITSKVVDKELSGVYCQNEQVWGKGMGRGRRAGLFRSSRPKTSDK